MSDLTRYQFECNIEQVDGHQIVEVMARDAQHAVDRYHEGYFEIVHQELRVREVSLIPDTIKNGHLVPLLPRRIFVCSPFQTNEKRTQEENTEWAKEYSRYVFQQGHVPFTPHLLYPQILDESNPVERQKGIEAGKVWLPFCHEVWVFGRKRGEETQGMKQELIKAEMGHGIPIKRIEAPF